MFRYNDIPSLKIWWFENFKEYFMNYSEKLFFEVSVITLKIVFTKKFLGIEINGTISIN